MHDVTSNYVRDMSKSAQIIDCELFKTQLEGEFKSAPDSKNFVRKLNKEGIKFEKLGGGWEKLVGPRIGSYGQN